jgi:hypothetical protein
MHVSCRAAQLDHPSPDEAIHPAAGQERAVSAGSRNGGGDCWRRRPRRASSRWPGSPAEWNDRWPSRRKSAGKAG